MAYEGGSEEANNEHEEGVLDDDIGCSKFQDKEGPKQNRRQGKSLCYYIQLWVTKGVQESIQENWRRGSNS